MVEAATLEERPAGNKVRVECMCCGAAEKAAVEE
jgi:hypothetical protein